MRKAILVLMIHAVTVLGVLACVNSVLAQAKLKSPKPDSAKLDPTKADLAKPDTTPAKSENKIGSDYKIAPADILVVDVVGEATLQNKERRVSSSGTITFPYLKGLEIKVQDKTTLEVERELRDLLMKDYFVKPEVAVAVKEYRKRTVTVIGEVNKQGPVEFPGEQEMNIFEAIGSAGGFTRLANKKNITITRKSKQFKFNVKDWLNNSDKSKTFILKPGDVILVPESTF